MRDRRVRVWGVAVLLVGGLVASVDRAEGGSDPLSVLTAKSVLVLDNPSGKVLYARNAGEVRSIASLTKLMAALVFRQRGLALRKGTRINRQDYKVALGGSRTRLELKWTYRNRDLLHAALMASDNRAVSALGRAVRLDARGLVREMNALAKRMDLNRTHFRGPVGLHYGNVSTAWDLSRIVRRAAKDPVLRKVMGTSTYTVRPMRGYINVHYRNTDPFVGASSRLHFRATKTGFNRRAGYCIAVVVDIRGHGPVTVVLLGSRSAIARVEDLRKVFRWLGVKV